MTTLGFFSVVQHRELKDHFIIRARKIEHLDKLKELAGIKLPIEFSPKADYAFRLLISKKHWNKVMRRLLDEVTYPNFKDAAEIRGGKSERDYIHALHEVWSTMMFMQLQQKR